LEKHSAESRAPALQQHLSLTLPVTTEDHAAIQELRNLNPDAMTPREALDALYRLKTLSDKS